MVFFSANLTFEQLIQKDLGDLDPLYLNGGASALFTSASQRQSSRIVQEVIVLVLVAVPIVLIFSQVQSSTFSTVEGIRSTLAQAGAQSLQEISVLQNSTLALISSLSTAVSKIFADSAIQVSVLKSTTTFLLEDVYGDFLALAAESDAKRASILNATSFLVSDVNDNTKYSLASAGARSVLNVLHFARLNATISSQFSALNPFFSSFLTCCTVLLLQLLLPLLSSYMLESACANIALRGGSTDE